MIKRQQQKINKIKSCVPFEIQSEMKKKKDSKRLFAIEIGSID